MVLSFPGWHEACDHDREAAAAVASRIRGRSDNERAQARGEGRRHGGQQNPPAAAPHRRRAAMSLRQDIYCAAHVLMAVYGEEAGVDAALKATELAATGDVDGAALWRQIALAIDDLVAGERLHWGMKQ
jgi:hypothetical protein